MAKGFITMTMVPSANVATAGTLVFNYPSGNASQFAQTGETLIVSGLQNTLPQSAGTFTLVYGATFVTVTYTDSTTIPAGSVVTLQAPLAVYKPLVDSSGGTASNTVPVITGAYVQADLRNAFASLTAKVNALIALSADRDNVPE